MTRSRWTRRRFLRNAALVGVALGESRRMKAWNTEPSHSGLIDTRAAAQTIFYGEPASSWPDALPVGNGRLGAMVFGAVAKERLQLNEETVWMGERRNRNNPQANRTPEVRALLLAGKVHEAEALAQQVMMGVPDRLPCYQTLGDLWLEFDGIPEDVQQYRLELNLDTAIVSTRFSDGDVQ